MIIDKLTVEVSPVPGLYRDSVMQFKIEVKVRDREILTVQRMESQDHIMSVFDFMVEDAVRQLKQHLLKVNR